MSTKKTLPPRWADYLLEWFCSDRYLEIIQGDLYELYYHRLEEMPRWQARLYFMRDVLDVMRPFAWRPREPYNLKNQVDMLKNYFKTAYRGLLRRKAYALINILGLALGISICLILSAAIKTELQYDAFHSQGEQIYRVNQIREKAQEPYYRPYLPFPAAKAMREDFSDIEKITQVQVNWSGSIQVEDNYFSFDHVLFADEYFLDVFDFKMLQGNKALALKEPNTVILTQTAAQQIFGNRDPYGKLIQLDEKLSLRVTGVVEDPPANSHLPFEILVSLKSFTNDYYPLDADLFTTWGLTDHASIYFLLPEQASPEDYSDRLTQFIQKYLNKEEAEGLVYELQALKDIHFDMRFASRNPGRTISMNIIWVYLSLGLFILLVACINFINLSTAQASMKNKEVGIRKVIGANRGQLITQFLMEAFVLTSLATLIALSLIQLIIPIASELLGFKLSVNLLGDPFIWIFIGGTIILVSLLAGFYPAFVMSAFQPTHSLRSLGLGKRGNKAHLRRGLIVFQFLVTQMLIIGTLIAYEQMQFFYQKDLGYTSEAVLLSGLPTSGSDSLKLARYKTRLKNQPEIAQVAFSSSPASNNVTLSGGVSFPSQGEDTWYGTQLRGTDKDFLATYDLELIAGKNIENSLGGASEFVINETLVKKAGYKSPEEVIGLKIIPSWGMEEGEIVGVVKDFHNKSLQNEISPCVIQYVPDIFWQACIRIQPNQNVSAVTQKIEQIYEKNFPGSKFIYEFEDERLARYYQEESRLFQTFQLFALIAIVIASFGLFGLISFIALQKTKEIGIRKVLGASLTDIISLLSGEFIKLMLMAFLLAAPLAYYLMQDWLQDFAYRVEISWWIFGLAALISLIITVITIFYQTLKTALLNPVNALRYE